MANSCVGADVEAETDIATNDAHAIARKVRGRERLYRCTLLYLCEPQTWNRFKGMASANFSASLALFPNVRFLVDFPGDTAPAYCLMKLNSTRIITRCAVASTFEVSRLMASPIQSLTLAATRLASATFFSSAASRVLRRSSCVFSAR